jgi:hydroxymethylglutaryl-CoA lyase
MANRTVKLVECPRDAWQGLPKQIPTELKVRYLRALIDAGFKHVDAVSFVSPKAVPQMTDSEEVLEQLEMPDDVEIIGIVVNEKGAERAIATGRVTTLGYPCSTSETFLRRNQNQSPAENIAALSLIKRRADECNIDIVAYISMAFGNPYGNRWDESEVTQTVAQITALGLRQISLADTVGIATPELIRWVVRRIIEDFGDAEIGVHLHGTRDDATTKVLAAYDAGCRRFDSAIGGLGGCPFAQDALVGNIPTEVVLDALRACDVDLLPVGGLERVSAISALIGSRFGAAA